MASPIQLVDLIKIREFAPKLFSVFKTVPESRPFTCLNANLYSIEIKEMAPLIRRFILFIKRVCIIDLSDDVEIGNSKLGKTFIY